MRSKVTRLVVHPGLTDRTLSPVRYGQEVARRELHGLYLPEHWPQFSRSTIGDFAGLPYAEVAYRVMRPFIGGAFADMEYPAKHWAGLEN